MIFPTFPWLLKLQPQRSQRQKILMKMILHREWTLTWICAVFVNFMTVPKLGHSKYGTRCFFSFFNSSVTNSHSSLFSYMWVRYESISDFPLTSSTLFKLFVMLYNLILLLLREFLDESGHTHRQCIRFIYSTSRAYLNKQCGWNLLFDLLWFQIGKHFLNEFTDISTFWRTLLTRRFSWLTATLCFWSFFAKIA